MTSAALNKAYAGAVQLVGIPKLRAHQLHELLDLNQLLMVLDHLEDAVDLVVVQWISLAHGLEGGRYRSGTAALLRCAVRELSGAPLPNDHLTVWVPAEQWVCPL